MVEGIPAYYPRFGFEHASALGFISPHAKIPVDAFMVKRLPGYSPDLAGCLMKSARVGYEQPRMGQCPGMNPERTTHGAAGRRDASPPLA
jgi:hypothetical protein